LRNQKRAIPHQPGISVQKKKKGKGLKYKSTLAYLSKGSHVVSMGENLIKPLTLIRNTGGVPLEKKKKSATRF